MLDGQAEKELSISRFLLQIIVFTVGLIKKFKVTLLFLNLIFRAVDLILNNFPNQVWEGKKSGYSKNGKESKLGSEEKYLKSILFSDFGEECLQLLPDLCRRHLKHEDPTLVKDVVKERVANFLK